MIHLIFLFNISAILRGGIRTQDPLALLCGLFSADACPVGGQYLVGSTVAVRSQDRPSSEKRLNKPCGQTPHTLELPVANLAATISRLVPGQSGPTLDPESSHLRLLMSQITPSLDPRAAAEIPKVALHKVY